MRTSLPVERLFQEWRATAPVMEVTSRVMDAAVDGSVFVVRVCW
jgi:hypothetical protein